ncbi:GAF domain-containing protein [Actinoplanes subtropicus]|uniref:GAF domain-containing protein n=1 Tax=Actinoplanes subtropicus TaxID=543632 RepID=UPI0004C39E30|nr:GAF domain-containing protein [Actinoplanes subtropicus]
MRNVHEPEAISRTSPATPEETVLLLGSRVQLLERVLAVQQAAMRRASLQEVFDAVTAGAHGLLGDEIGSLRLRDRTDPSMLQLASAYGMPDRVAWQSWRMPLDGCGAAGQAILRDEVVVINCYDHSLNGIQELAENGVRAAMAAPVRDGGTAIGSLSVASRRPGRGLQHHRPGYAGHLR